MASGNYAAPLAMQLRPPPIRLGVVDRAGLLERITSADAHIVTITAPPGYGKTILMSLWKERETRPAAWLNLDRYDNDPSILHTSVVAALQHAGMLDAHPAGNSHIPSDLVISHGVTRLAEALSRGPTGVLMLDHAEALVSRKAIDTVAELTMRLPPNIQLVIASRVIMRLPLAQLRAQGALLELSTGDLAMDETEARQLLVNTGIDLDDDLDEVIDHTEGWPAGLYLVASAAKAGSSRRSPLRISGRDRFVADYLREQVLGNVSDERLSFLIRTSILDQFCGSLCDAVLEGKGSADTIDELETSNLLVVPLDRTRDWYRYHHLLQDFLQAELHRRAPDDVAGLHSRAAAWCAANDMIDEAITHAQAADDADTVARLMGPVVRRTYAEGRADTVGDWLRWFERTGRIDHYPDLAARGSVYMALSGDVIGAERWSSAIPQGASTPIVSFLRGILAKDGVDQMLADARAAQKVESPDSTWLTAAIGLEGFAHLWRGDVDEADAVFGGAVTIGERELAMPTVAYVLGGRAVIAADRGDWDDATRHVGQSLGHTREHGLERYITSGLAFAVGARVAAHHGQVELARRRLTSATALLPKLTTATPAISVHTLLEMARAHLAVSDVTGARTVMRQSAGILAQRPDLGLLSKQQDELAAQLGTMTSSGVGASALTAAELRLLPFLVTHLSFPEIGERLFISRNTVKTHAMSIYRKLGASSRSEAVYLATETGLLTT